MHICLYCWKIYQTIIVFDICYFKGFRTLSWHDDRLVILHRAKQSMVILFPHIIPVLMLYHSCLALKHWVTYLLEEGKYLFFFEHLEHRAYLSKSLELNELDWLTFRQEEVVNDVSICKCNPESTIWIIYIFLPRSFSIFNHFRIRLVFCSDNWVQSSILDLFHSNIRHWNNSFVLVRIQCIVTNPYKLHCFLGRDFQELYQV